MFYWVLLGFAEFFFVSGAFFGSHSPKTQKKKRSNVAKPRKKRRPSLFFSKKEAKREKRDRKKDSTTRLGATKGNKENKFRASPNKRLDSIRSSFVYGRRVFFFCKKKWWQLFLCVCVKPTERRLRKQTAPIDRSTGPPARERERERERVVNEVIVVQIRGSRPAHNTPTRQTVPC